MFGQVLDKIDGWVGRSFLFVSFFPFLIFLGANALMAQFIVPDVTRYVLASFSDYGSSISGLVIWIAAAAALAYVIDPLIGQSTKLLEGTSLPPWISIWLSTDHTRKARQLELKEQELGQERYQLSEYRKKTAQEIERARVEGVAKAMNANPKQIRNACDQLGKLEAKMRSQQLIKFCELQKTGMILEAALRNNCADATGLLPALAPTPPRRWFWQRKSDPQTLSDQLGGLAAVWTRLVAYAQEKAISEHSRVVRRKQSEFGSIPTKDQPNWILMQAPTRFGNNAAALRSFFEKRFQFDFEFFWPIVQLVVQGDQKIMEALTNAKQRLDFCVRILLYTIIFTAIWLLVATFEADRAWIVLALGTGGLVLAALWLEMVLVNYRSLSELIRSIIILKRFEVLKALRQALPQNWESEQAIWKNLTTQLLWGSDVKITYLHDK